MTADTLRQACFFFAVGTREDSNLSIHVSIITVGLTLVKLG